MSEWALRSRWLRRGSVLGLSVVSLLLAACGSGAPKGDGVRAVATGYRHTCAVTDAGGVRCWGANESGQLGNGATTASSTPVDVVGLTHGAVAVAAGAHHSCVLTDAGGVKCWGLNDGGQLGNGTNINSSRPVGVRGLASGVTAIAAGAGWVCALTSAGGVKCWGWNHYGQLGNGRADDTSTTPVGVSGLATGVKAISANGLHACALTTTGHVKCWGSSSDPASLQTKGTDSRVPIAVSSLGGDAAAISAGGLHACVITRAGVVKCWGTNRDGELGNGSKVDSNSPVAVSNLTKGATSLSAGSTDDFLPTHTCALTRTGGVECWGPNRDGQLGNGSTTDSSRPVEASDLTSGVLTVAIGGSHTCAITKDHRLKCWGANSAGQLGNGSNANSPTPVDVRGL